MDNILIIDSNGKLLISKDELIRRGVFTDSFYRKSKSIVSLLEVKNNFGKYVLFDSLTVDMRKKTLEKFLDASEHSKIISESEDKFMTCTYLTYQTALIFAFLNCSEMLAYINTHHTAYNLYECLATKKAVKCAKQYALSQWVSNRVKYCITKTDKERRKLLLISFRYILYIISTFNVAKELFPKSNFDSWFDDIVRKNTTKKCN